MTEQELKDGEAYQASPEGAAAALVFELERVTNMLEVMARDLNQPALLYPELTSIRIVMLRLDKLFIDLVYGSKRS